MGPKGSSWISSISFSRSSSSTARKVAITSLWFSGPGAAAGSPGFPSGCAGRPGWPPSGPGWGIPVGGSPYPLFLPGQKARQARSRSPSPYRFTFGAPCPGFRRPGRMETGPLETFPQGLGQLLVFRYSTSMSTSICRGSASSSPSSAGAWAAASGI